MPRTSIPASHPAAIRARRAGGGFTLTEVIIALAVVGLLMAGLASHMIESVALNTRITASLEHSRNAREMINALSGDIRAAQIVRLYPGFSDRSTEARDGQTGNYLVLQNVDETGAITRTAGYYAIALSGNQGWAIHRHDSDAGDHAADDLPSIGSAGTHRLIKRAQRLPDSNHVFRNSRERGITVRGEFAPANVRGSGRPEFITCTIQTRS